MQHPFKARSLWRGAGLILKTIDRVIGIVVLTAISFSFPQGAQAENVYSEQFQPGWRADIKFSPPNGWQRANGPDAVWYILSGVPTGACSIIFPKLETMSTVDSISAFREWHQSSIKAGQVLNQTELAWGTSEQSATTFWRMQGAELRLPNGTPVTILSYMGESKSVRQRAVYQCVGIGAIGTTYAGVSGRELPNAISAFKSLVVDVVRSGSSQMSRPQCMLECGALAFELQNDCRMECMKNYK